MNLEPSAIDSLAWEKQGGLLPAIVQHARSGAVLMLAYMNREALRTTLERGQAVFYSRSRRKLWVKGEESGHTLQVTAVGYDCDGDTLLVSALPTGPVCHLGTSSCFGEDPPAAVPLTAIDSPESFLAALEEVIDARIATGPEGSYTAQLHGRGLRHVAQKVGEEGLEVALAGAGEPDERLVAESADLLFHLLVLLRSRQLRLREVVAELRARHACQKLPLSP